MTKPKAKAEKPDEKPKKIVAPKVPSMEGGLNYLLKKAEQDSTMKDRLIRNSEITKNWVYTDFTDPKNKCPCLLLEWLFGTRGLLNGKVLKTDADEATGKSSLLLLMYGMFQCAPKGVFIINNETENADMVPDRTYYLGCEPKSLITYKPRGVVDCLSKSEELILDLRKNVDPERTIPIVLGIDSVSGLSNQGIDPDTDEMYEDGQGAGLGFHARKFSEFFRNKLDYFAFSNVIIMATGQAKSKIIKTSFGQQSGGQTTMADKSFKFHASWIIDMSTAKMQNDANGAVITCKTVKNKLAPNNRTINLHLYKDKRGWDLLTPTAQLLFAMGDWNPDRETGLFDKDSYSSGGGRYTHKDVNGGKSLYAQDFMLAFYQNADLVRQCRERMKIRGFGLAFESDYRNRDAAVEKEEVADEVPDTTDAG